MPLTIKIVCIDFKQQETNHIKCKFFKKKEIFTLSDGVYTVRTFFEGVGDVMFEIYTDEKEKDSGIVMTRPDCRSSLGPNV